MSKGSLGPRRVALASAAALAVALLALVGCGGSGDGGGGGSAGSAETAPDLGTGYPGMDPASTRSAEGEIESANVGELEVAWSVPLTARSSYGSFSSPPVVVGDVVYGQDLMSNVMAIDLESGEEVWTKRYEEADQGPNGIVVAEGKVFGATASFAFALDQETGEELWATPLLRDAGSEAIDMAPGYERGLVYVSTVPVLASSRYPGGGVGTLYALDTDTGEKAWHFDTVPRGLWGNERVNSGGGLWYQPSFDGKGFMYFGTGNPAPYPGTAADPWGRSRPGPNLYTNSVVKLNSRNGKLEWYHQVTPHDLYDWDFQDPPVLVEANGRELAIGAGKSGLVVALDRDTGKVVWELAVGRHNGRGEDGLKAMRGEYGRLEPGMVYPGYLGGVLAPMATDGELIFVPVVNSPVTVDQGTQLDGSPEASGELVAVDIATGREAWTAQLETPAYGAPTVINDVVFATSFAGGLHAFEASSGGELWQAALPAAINTGVTVAGDTVIAPAGMSLSGGQQAQIVAYRLGGE